MKEAQPQPIDTYIHTCENGLGERDVPAVRESTLPTPSQTYVMYCTVTTGGLTE